MRRFIVCLLALALLTGCGWRLRGTMALPEGLSTVFVNNETDSAVLASTMDELLQANQVELSDSPGAAQLVINLLRYDEERRVVSIGDNTLVTEFELIAEAEFSVEDSQGNLMLPDNSISVIRAYQFDEDNVLGKAEEERLIQEEMRRDIAQQIIRRLRFLELSDGTAQGNAAQGADPQRREATQP